MALTTKSDLAARDAALLARLAARNEVRVNFTVTTLDERLARRLEPGAPRPDLRLEALRRLSAAGIAAAVFASPVLPGINDGEGELERLARAARQAGAEHFGAQMLFLREPARTVFFEMLDREFPRLLRQYRRLFARGTRVEDGLREALALRVARIREDLGFAGRPARGAPVWGQLPLFSEDAPAQAGEGGALIQLRNAVRAASRAAARGCPDPARFPEAAAGPAARCG